MQKKYLPLQTSQASGALVVTILPAGHALQSVFPVPALDFPGAQFVQL